jgi:hypothetical protein
LARTKEALLTMPILKVSNDIKKYALEIIKVPISIIGDCPQCQGNGYRDGICPDCNYIDARVQEAIAEWQQAMGIQQVIDQQQQGLAEQTPNSKSKKKAAYGSLSFVDVLPSMNQTKVKCPSCGEMSFNNDSLKKGQLSGECENPKCRHEIAGETGFKRPKFLGIDPRMIKNIRRNFPSPATLKIEDTKKKLKKSAKESYDPGAVLDDSMVVKTDATSRMKNMLQQNAQIELQNKNDKTNEEQQ